MLRGIENNYYDVSNGFNKKNLMLRLALADTKQQVEVIERNVRSKVEKMNKLEPDNQDIINKMEDVINKAQDKSSLIEKNQENGILECSAEQANEVKNRSENLAMKLASNEYSTYVNNRNERGNFIDLQIDSIRNTTNKDKNNTVDTVL